jgi:hypothetical protein
MGLRMEKREAQVGSGFLLLCENLSHAHSKTAHWIGRVELEAKLSSLHEACCGIM